MNSVDFEKILAGGDLRSIGKSNSLVNRIKNQTEFDALFQCLFHAERLVVMRAADAIEKITLQKPEYLAKHRKKIVALCNHANNKELKWHLAQLLPRLSLTKPEYEKVWQTLQNWALDKNESRIVRVNALQGLYDSLHMNRESVKDFKWLLLRLTADNIPSLTARCRKLDKLLKSIK